MRKFNTISIEPTFYYDFSPLKIDVDNMDEDNFDTLQSVMINEFLDNRKKYKNPLLKKAHIDHDALEISFQKDSVKNILSKFGSLQKFLKRKGFIPSSIVSLETEGGCHLNVDLTDIKEKTNLLVNLRNYLLSNQCIAWSFLSPYDEQSSVHSEYSIFDLRKGDFFTVRSVSSSDFGSSSYISDYGMPDQKEKAIRYVELRFFCMPKNSKELQVNIEFAQKLLRYLEANDIEFPNNWELNPVKLETEIEKLKTVCKKIGFPYKTLEKYGKVQNLEDRFHLQSIQHSRNYLI